jgi:hypothetical protein
MALIKRFLCREKGLPYSPLPAPIRDHSVAPWWEGMDEELVKMFKRWYRSCVNPRYYEVSSPQTQIDRISATELTVQEFIERYERASKPVLISDITKKWAAQYNWTKEKLLERHADTKFRTGGGFKMKLRRFFRYLERQHEQQPLYLFDQNYPENAEPMGSEYAVPPYFPEDLFEITGEDDRPPYRWILVGPAGSGAPFHTDPRGTSAWNTVLSGKKRCVLFRFCSHGYHLSIPFSSENTADGPCILQRFILLESDRITATTTTPPPL